jgi:hypothetical protein
MNCQHAHESLAHERYLLDEMSEIERYDFEAHFFECEACATAMRFGHQLRADAKAIFDQKPSSDERSREDTRVAWWQQPWRPAIPWAAAAVLAIALVAQVRSPGGPPSVELSGAYDPVALRPASRGAAAVVPLPHTDEHAAALALDVNIGAPGNPIAYTLTRDTGDNVLSGRAKVPAPGVPLVLLVPREQLVAGGSYTLILRRTDDPSGPGSEYRFTVAAR